MAFNIGFTANSESTDNNTAQVQNDTNVGESIKKSLVDVYFPDRNLTCSYYNDTFNLKKGDYVYVEGKLEGLRGRVTGVSYTFKIKLSNYKRVIGVACTDINGDFYLAGAHFITPDSSALNYEKAITWFRAPEEDDMECVFSDDGESFSLNDLSGMKISKAVSDRGYGYYMENRVLYFELNRGKGRAIVRGTEIYEVEFNYKNRETSSLVCSCYCSGACKHEFAVMLQLIETLDTVAEKYPFIDAQNYLAAVSKSAFCEFVLDKKESGKFTLN